MRVVIVNNEISPFVGGGIAAGIRATAQVLAGGGHEVDLFTLSRYRQQARDARHRRLPLFTNDRITWHWVNEPNIRLVGKPYKPGEWHLSMAYNFRDAIIASGVAEYADLVQISDYSGLGALVSQALHTMPIDSRPRIVTRLHSSSEIVAALDRNQIDPDWAEVFALERISLLNADILLAPSPAVDELYRRFYASLDLPPASAFWPALLRDELTTAAAPSIASADDPLRLLFLARLQEFKGIVPLVEAVVAHPALDLKLTIVGTDTPSAPDGGSMRSYIERLAAGDSRIEVMPGVQRELVGEMISAHDALIMPSRWETFGNVCVEALAVGRPLLVTPTASLPKMTDYGHLGLVANGFDAAALGAMLTAAVERRDWLRGLPATAELRDLLGRLCSDEAVVAGYELLAVAERRVNASTIATTDVTTLTAELLADGGSAEWGRRNIERIGGLVTAIAPEAEVSV